MTWWAWPAARAPVRSIFSFLLVGIGVAAAAEVHRIMGVAAAALLLTSVGEFLFPTRFQIDDEGLRISGVHAITRKKWSQLAGWRRIPAGFLIRLKGRQNIPFIRRTRVIYCFCDLDKVVDFLKDRLPEDAPDAEKDR